MPGLEDESAARICERFAINARIHRYFLFLNHASSGIADERQNKPTEPTGACSGDNIERAPRGSVCRVLETPVLGYGFFSKKKSSADGCSGLLESVRQCRFDRREHIPASGRCVAAQQVTRIREIDTGRGMLGLAIVI